MKLNYRIDQLAKIGLNKDGTIYRKAGSIAYYDAIKKSF